MAEQFEMGYRAWFVAFGESYASHFALGSNPSDPDPLLAIACWNNHDSPPAHCRAR
jgi:hypothetical protein